MATSRDADNTPPDISVLFVCLGNICRSPMAEAVFTHLTSAWSKDGSGRPMIHVDSAGTGAYHEGSDPDPRTMATLQDHGVTKFSHAARQVKAQDFEHFDYVIAMDRMNLRDLKRRAKQVKNINAAEEKISLFGSWENSSQASGGKEIEDPYYKEIDDPYYGGDEGFETAFEQCVRFSRGWMKTVLNADAVIHDRKGGVVVTSLDDE